MELIGELNLPPSHLTPGGRAPGTHWIGDLVGSRDILDLVEKKKILHCWESDQAIEPVACYCTN
jgi:hypothetical protein